MEVDAIAVLIPIIGIIGGVGIAIVGIVTTHRLRLQRAEFRHRERLAAIEKGLELPPDPPDAEPRGKGPGTFLHHGLVLVALGVTLAAALIKQGTEPALFGFIPAAIGIAYLLYYVAYARHHKPAATGQPPSDGPPAG
jgi:hypothetical protein